MSQSSPLRVQLEPGLSVRVEDVLRASEQRLRELPSIGAATLQALEHFVEIVRDKDWQLPPSARRRIIALLARLADPGLSRGQSDSGREPLPPQVSELASLLAHELRHELDAYREFARYRAARLRGRRGDEPAERLLHERRRRLRARIQARRMREGGLALWLERLRSALSLRRLLG